MNVAVVETTPSAVRVYVSEAGGARLIHELDLTTRSGKAECRRWAAELLQRHAEAMVFIRDDREYRVHVGPRLVAKLAELGW